VEWLTRLVATVARRWLLRLEAAEVTGVVDDKALDAVGRRSPFDVVGTSAARRRF
jgi:hypothetical protein